VADHLVLLAPSSNRVYAGAADALAAAELRILLKRDEVPVEPVEVAGVGYLRLGVDALDDDTAAALGRLSATFAIFRREADLLRPVPLARPDQFDDDLITIPKYPGKTNEQLTRLLVNVTLASGTRGSEAVTVLDPMCGRGTTLSTALTLGHDAAGVESDLKAIEAYAAFLRTYLRRKRLKHTADLTPVRREGKTLGRRLDVTVTPEHAHEPRRLTVFSGDTRQSAALYGKRRFDAVVVDAPYGVVHASQNDGRRHRSVAGLLGEALPVWAGQLKHGGALGVAWNTYNLTREALADLAVQAGLEPLAGAPYLSFGHRVDSSIHRDVFVAVRP